MTNYDPNQPNNQQEAQQAPRPQQVEQVPQGVPGLTYPGYPTPTAPERASVPEPNAAPPSAGIGVVQPTSAQSTPEGMNAAPGMPTPEQWNEFQKWYQQQQRASADWNPSFTCPDCGRYEDIRVVAPVAVLDPSLNTDKKQEEIHKHNRPHYVCRHCGWSGDQDHFENHLQSLAS